MSTAASSPPTRYEPLLIYGVAVIACAAPLAIGSVHPTTQLIMSAATLLLACGYVASRGRYGVRVTPFVAVAALGALLTAAQLVPLPGGLVRLLSPHAWEIRRDVDQAALLPLTLDVPATLLALLRALACFGLLVVTVGVARRRGAARRLAYALAALGAGMALIAFVQRALNVNAILGIYEPRSAPGFGFFGTFVDVNHTASIVELGALAAIGLALEVEGQRRGLFVAAATLSAAALLYSTSRGGLLGFGVGSFFLSTVLLARRFGVVRAVGGALVILLVAATVTLWTSEGLRQRFLPASTATLWRNQKTRGWRDGMRMTRDYFWTGVGRGAFEAPLSAYRDDDEGIRLVYPESFPVQLASEWGAPASLAFFALALFAVRRTAPGMKDLGPGVLGVAAGAIAVVVHELMDFGTEMPGVAFPLVVAVGVVVGRATAKAAKPRRLHWQTTAPIAAAWMLALAGGAWAAHRTLDADDRRLQVAVAAGGADEAELRRAIQRHPADDYLEVLAAHRALRLHDPSAMAHLNRALRLHRGNWPAHQLAGRLLAGIGRRSQAALEYRLAIQYGLNEDDGELVRLLGGYIIDAVPQQPHELLALAHRLLGIERPREAAAAAQRAVDLAEGREPILAERVKVFLELNANLLLPAAARALAAEATDGQSFALAARGLAAGGQRTEALTLLDRARKMHSGDATLVLLTARLRADGGDLAGARVLLDRADVVGFTLAERKQAEELLAEIAERAGDLDTAVLARARARMIAHQLAGGTK
jgi:tetratricopeptide (TPR) repeat protein